MALSYPTHSSQEDYSSSEQGDSSSTEDCDESTSSSEDEDEDDGLTEENGVSSVEDENSGASSVEEGNDIRQGPGTNLDEAVSDSIISLRPGIERPNISLELVKNSSIAEKLPDFLAQIRAANEELEKEKSAGTLAKRRIEIDESDRATEGEEHIEMNLGLGVLEEKGDDMSTNSESEAGNEHGDRSIMDRLLGGKRKQGLGNDDGGMNKKVKIQEL